MRITGFFILAAIVLMVGCQPEPYPGERYRQADQSTRVDPYQQSASQEPSDLAINGDETSGEGGMIEPLPPPGAGEAAGILPTGITTHEQRMRQLEAIERSAAGGGTTQSSQSETDYGSGTTIPTDVRTYTVQRGDTLTGIALKELGSARRWREIAALNPGIDPDRIQAGQELLIPSH